MKHLIEISFNLTEYRSKWLHVTATYDESNRTARLYVNGDLVAYNDSVSKGIVTDDPIFVGALDTSFPLRGTLDEIRMYNYSLTPVEVKANWNKPLTRDKMHGVMLYFNADGDGYDKFIDKSGYGRHGTPVGITVVEQVISRTNYIANCKGCFDGSELSFCIPNEENTGYCGDGSMLGDKECDGGDNCLDNCTCEEGYYGNGYGGCLAYKKNCMWMETLTECESTLDPNCDCDCFINTGMKCLVEHGCYTDSAPYQLYRTWVSCITACSSNFSACYEDSK